MEKQVQSIGRREQKTDIDGGFHVDDKLFRQSGIYKLNRKTRTFCPSSPSRNTIEQTVGDERIVFRGKDDRKHSSLNRNATMPHSTVAMAIFIREALNTSKCSQNDISPI